MTTATEELDEQVVEKFVRALIGNAVRAIAGKPHPGGPEERKAARRFLTATEGRAAELRDFLCGLVDVNSDALRALAKRDDQKLLQLLQRRLS